MSLRWKIWCGGVWYVAKEHVEFANLKNPSFVSGALSRRNAKALSFTSVIRMYSKTLEILTSYSQPIQLHGNGSTLLDFT